MSCCLPQDAKSSQDGIGELPGQTSLELWVKNIVAGLFLLDNTPSFHSNGRMLNWNRDLRYYNGCGKFSP